MIRKTTEGNQLVTTDSKKAFSKPTNYTYEQPQYYCRRCHRSVRKSSVLCTTENAQAWSASSLCSFLICIVVCPLLLLCTFSCLLDKLAGYLRNLPGKHTKNTTLMIANVHPLQYRYQIDRRYRKPLYLYFLEEIVSYIRGCVSGYNSFSSYGLRIVRKFCGCHQFISLTRNFVFAVQ